MPEQEKAPPPVSGESGGSKKKSACHQYISAVGGAQWRQHLHRLEGRGLVLLPIGEEFPDGNDPVVLGGTKPPTPAVEVLSSTGQWIPGYELIRFEVDGQVLIRSRRTGVSRHLSLDQWRDPCEIAALASLAMGVEGQP